MTRADKYFFAILTFIGVLLTAAAIYFAPSRAEEKKFELTEQAHRIDLAEQRKRATQKHSQKPKQLATK